MSQKEGKFQSKPRGAGGKFSGKGKGGGAKPAGRGFSKRSEGDRDTRSFGDKPYKKRTYGSDDRPARGDFGDRKPRFAGGEGTGGRDRKPRFDKDSRGGKSFGDRKPRFDREDGDRKPRGSFGDRKPRFEREDGDRKPRGSFGDRKPRFDREDGDRKPRGSFGDRKPRFDREDGDRKPRGSFGDRKPRFEREDGAEARPVRKKDNGFKGGRSFKRYEDDKKPSRARDASFERDFDAAPASDETRAKLKSGRSSLGSPSPAYLYGVHAVTQALQNPQRVNKRLICTESGYAAVQKAFDEANDDGLAMPQVITVEKEDIDRLLPRDAVHQDLLLDSEPLEETFLSDLIISAADDALVVVLDQVTDPHNVGAILRSAAAFGAMAVVVQKLNAPDITGVLAKSASGAVEHVPIVREVNLSRAIEQLKEAGFFCIGLAERGKSTLAGLKLGGAKVAIVLGAEGDGLRRLVAEKCDDLVHLPTQGEIGSLNVSNAAAVALYELVRGRKGA